VSFRVNDDIPSSKKNADNINFTHRTRAYSTKYKSTAKPSAADEQNLISYDLKYYCSVSGSFSFGFDKLRK